MSSVGGAVTQPLTRRVGDALGSRRHQDLAGPVRVLLAVLAVVQLAVVLRMEVAHPLVVAGDSMVPTLGPGDIVLVDQGHDTVAGLERGDLVTFTSPQDGELTLKRVVGLPGDRVEIRDALLHVDGVLVREPYVDPEAIDATYWGPVDVPPDMLLVLGDNRGPSVDSRDYGPVPARAVHGRALVGLRVPQMRPTVF